MDWITEIEVFRQPSNWRSMAQQFYCAADILYEAIINAPSIYATVGKSLKDPEAEKLYETFSKAHSSKLPLQVLMGYSIENLLKGIIVKQYPHDIQEGKAPKWTKHHDLNKLAKKANIDLSDEEKKLVTILSETIGWGKYPVKKIPQNTTYFDFYHHPHTIRDTTQIYAQFRTLYKKLQNKY